MGLTQTGLTANFTYMLNKQAHHVAQLITLVNERKARSIEPTREAEAEWVRIVAGSNPMTKYQSVCTPGYYNGEGTSEGGFLQAVYPNGALAFFDMLAHWREQGDFEGLIVK
jgi:cyclohexanone monooxygenase